MSNRNFDNRVIIQRLQNQVYARNLYINNTTGQKIINNPQNSDGNASRFNTYIPGAQTEFSRGLLGAASTTSIGGIVNIPPFPLIPHVPVLNNNFGWANRLGGSGFDIPVSLVLDSSNNIYMSGRYSSTLTIYNIDGTKYTTLANNGSFDTFIIKYDSYGNPLWANRLGGSGNIEPVSLVLDSSNNIYISGRYNNTLTIYNIDGEEYAIIPNNGQDDTFIIKYDSDGNPLWANRLGGAGQDQPVSLVLDSSNNIYMSGRYSAPLIIYNINGEEEYTTLPNNGSFDVFIIKYDSDGNPLWANRLGETSNNFASSNDQPVSLVLDSSNNIYLSGRYSFGLGGHSAITFSLTIYNIDGTEYTRLPNNKNPEIFIIKYDSDGNPIWANRLAGTSMTQPVSLVLDSSNNIYMSGTYSAALTIYKTDVTEFTTLANNGSEDTFIIKYNSDGNPLWANRLGSSGFDNPVSLVLDSSNNIYMSGRYGNTLTIYNIDGEVYTTLPKNGLNDIFIIKYKSDGNPIWANRLDGTSIIQPVSLVLDSSNNIYMSGRYGNTLTIYKTDVTEFTTLANNGSDDTFIIKYNSDGNPLWANRLGSSGFDNPVSLVLDSSNNIYMSGTYGNTLTIYNIDGEVYTTLPNNGQNDIFIIKYNSDGGFN